VGIANGGRGDCPTLPPAMPAQVGCVGIVVGGRLNGPRWNSEAMLVFDGGGLRDWTFSKD